MNKKGPKIDNYRKMRKKGNFHKRAKIDNFAKVKTKFRNSKKEEKKREKRREKKENGAHNHRSHCNFGVRKIFTSCCLMQL